MTNKISYKTAKDIPKLKDRRDGPYFACITCKEYKQVKGRSAVYLGTSKKYRCVDCTLLKQKEKEK